MTFSIIWLNRQAQKYYYFLEYATRLLFFLKTVGSPHDGRAAILHQVIVGTGEMMTAEEAPTIGR